MVEGREGEQRIQVLPPFALWPSRRSVMSKRPGRSAELEDSSRCKLSLDPACGYRCWAFSHPFLRLRSSLGSDRRDPHALPVCVWGLPKNPVRSFQLSRNLSYTTACRAEPKDFSSVYEASRRIRRLPATTRLERTKRPAKPLEPTKRPSIRRDGRAKAYRRPARVVDCNLRRCVQGRWRRSAGGTARRRPRADGRAAAKLRVCSVSSPSRRYISDD